MVILQRPRVSVRDCKTHETAELRNKRDIRKFQKGRRVLDYFKGGVIATHFPGSAEPPLQNPRLDEVQVDHEPAKEIVTDEAIAWAINEFKPYKTAGPDGLFSAPLQEGSKILTGHIGRWFTASVAHGYVPKIWRATRVVFIPKPGKENYCAAKSYRPISLTSFLMKALEKLVDRHMIEVVLK